MWDDKIVKRVFDRVECQNVKYRKLDHERYEITVIDNDGEKFEQESEIGFDAENNAFNAKGTMAEMVLMQIATGNEVFLIRCFDGMISDAKLNEFNDRILNNPKVFVVGFDMSNDLRALRQEVQGIKKNSTRKVK